jgi:hypothetical protein
MVTSGSPTRREFLKYSVASIAYGSLAMTASPTGATAKSSFDDYMTLSRNLTDMSGLDRAFGKIFYNSLVQSDRFSDGVDLQPNSMGQRSAQMMALEEEILLQWYTGVFGKRGEQKVAIYGEALMWQAMQLEGVPGYCRGEFGDWSRPPEI